MGGGDLNLKKSWHPLTRRNLEIVWELEQEQKKEKQKVEQLKKEKEQEREKDELRRIYKASGKERKPERLEWIYAGSVTTTHDHAQPSLSTPKGEDLARNDVRGRSGFTSDFTAGSRVDMKSKVREDPLFAILQHEQGSVERYERELRDSRHHHHGPQSRHKRSPDSRRSEISPPGDLIPKRHRPR